MWLVGDALYVHAKAMLAQVLLERAFAASIATGAAVKPWSWAEAPAYCAISPAVDAALRVLRPTAPRLRPQPFPL